MKSLLVILLAVSLTPTANADLLWNVTYLDGASADGFGTGNILGATRRATFEAALNHISDTFDTPADVTLDYRVNKSETVAVAGGAIASAGTYYSTAGTGYSNGRLFQHAQTGIDPSTNPDGFATFNFGWGFNSENDVPLFYELDLFTVALHEVTHSLGWGNLVSSTGDSQFGGNPGVYTVWNSMMELGDGTDLFDGAGGFLGTAADLESNDVFFNGANAMAANGGAPVKVYAPGSFLSGSSLAHVDDATFPGSVMTHAVGYGVSKKGYTALDTAILQDLGWSLKSQAASVPEPGSAALLGLGAIVVFRRKRQRERTA